MTKPANGFDKRPQDINLNGAPKRDWTWSGIIEQAVEKLGKSGKPVKQEVVNKLLDLANNGDIVAIKEIMNRLDGMPTQQTDITTKGKPLPTPIYGGYKPEV